MGTCFPKPQMLIEEHTYKVLLLGGAGVGKSSMLQRYIRGRFDTDHVPSSTCDVALKPIQLDGFPLIVLEIWDVPSAATTLSSQPVEHYFDKVDAALMVYDISDADESFVQLAPYHEKLRRSIHSDYSVQYMHVPTLLVANKRDLVTGVDWAAFESSSVIRNVRGRHVDSEDYATLDTCPQVAVSAKANAGLQATFKNIAARIFLSKNPGHQCKWANPRNPNPHGRLVYAGMPLENRAAFGFVEQLRIEELNKLHVVEKKAKMDVVGPETKGEARTPSPSNWDRGAAKPVETSTVVMKEAAAEYEYE